MLNIVRSVIPFCPGRILFVYIAFMLGFYNKIMVQIQTIMFFEPNKCCEKVFKYLLSSLHSFPFYCLYLSSALHVTTFHTPECFLHML